MPCGRIAFSNIIFKHNKNAFICKFWLAIQNNYLKAKKRDKHDSKIRVILFLKKCLVKSSLVLEMRLENFCCSQVKLQPFLFVSNRDFTFLFSVILYFLSLNTNNDKTHTHTHTKKKRKMATIEHKSYNETKSWC